MGLLSRREAIKIFTALTGRAYCDVFPDNQCHYLIVLCCLVLVMPDSEISGCLTDMSNTIGSVAAKIPW